MNSEQSTREQASAWWQPLLSSEKLRLWREYQKITFTPSHSPEELTGREIEEIWRKETLNTEQFKESLFKAYINKLSDKDKKLAIAILFEELPDSKDLWDDWMNTILDQQLESKKDSEIVTSETFTFAQYLREKK